MSYKALHAKKSRKLVVGLSVCAACVTVFASGYHLYKSNVYNNGNIIFINKGDSKYSDSINQLFQNYGRFETLMYDFINGNYGNYNSNDVDEFVHYLTIISTGNFKNYEKKLMYELEKSGFVVLLENYFENNEKEWEMVNRFANYYQEIVQKTYYNSFQAVDKIVDECTRYYHKYETQIGELSPVAQLVILKMVRPIIDTNDDSYMCFNGKINMFYDKQSTLSKIDKQIQECVNRLYRKCARYRV